MSNRLQIYSSLSEDLKKVYSSDKTLKIQSGIIAKHHIKNEDVYIDVIGDTILGFYKTSELTELLQKEVGVSADDAQRIFADLKEFLAPVIAREKGEVNPNHEELKELQEVFTPAPPPPTIQPTDIAIQSPSPEPTPPAPQGEHAEVQPMRTMESDITRIHGYGAYRAQFPDEVGETEHKEEVIRSASQEELLQEKPKLADMPTYEEEEEENKKE